MARARMMPPAWAKDEVLAECEPLARLCFYHLHGIADREGRIQYRPKFIRAECFPYDADVDIDRLLDQLEQHGFLARYSVGGQNYLLIPSFLDTQKPHMREARSFLPGPDETDKHLRGHAEGEPGASLGGEGASARWPVPESESESMSVRESVSGPVPKSCSKTETVSPKNGKIVERADDKRAKSKDEVLDARCREMFRDTTRDQSEDVLLDSLRFFARGLNPTRVELINSLKRVSAEWS